MGNVKELKNRITSVRNTRKITNAMYLISSAKLRKAREELEKTRPYFENTETEIRKIFLSAARVDSEFFHWRPVETSGCLVITADRGLAGAYNHNVLKAAEAEIAKRPGAVRLYVVGEYGRRYFKKHKTPYEGAFFYTAQDPTLRGAREIGMRLLEDYSAGYVDEIRVIYSDMENDVESVVRNVRLLPFTEDMMEDGFEEDELYREYRFEPSATVLLERMLPSYVNGFIYGALVDSFSAEQNARMNAMSNANRNAEELLGDLQIEYNRMRQAAITQEITEVSAGAKAQRRKRKKKTADPADSTLVSL
ncbi:MAG: ATP synthase F1 subunit gamma [Lachnospiraceae bacterium]|nr:ATP synthase F1 subunit gamma [Lachnospiraceae bacterium]